MRLVSTIANDRRQLKMMLPIRRRLALTLRHRSPEQPILLDQFQISIHASELQLRPQRHRELDPHSSIDFDTLGVPTPLKRSLQTKQGAIAVF